MTKYRVDVYKHDFIDRMATGKQNAITRRNRGLAVGSHASWNVNRSDYAPAPNDCPRHQIASIIEAWRWRRTDALEDYLRAVHPERYEAFE